MKLKALRLHGFKSFADRTEVRFHDGITAVVGPNGCGKSNISDAVRWVLGEQRPTAIRGSKMEEAIFQGTVNRRPVNRASVTMEVSNEDGALPVPFEEVEITRSVYRDGGSEYALNRSSCRLRDIQELCRDTGLGANAYAVIEGRMIDAILSDRADERRGLFEEAAGIGKYKDRRKAATRRLERAELDLQRLDDVIGEVRTKVRSLARQKGRAQRYVDLRERRLSLEVAVCRTEVNELQERLSSLERSLEEEGEGEGQQAELGATEARMEEIRIEQVEAEKRRSDVAGTLESVRSRLVEWERELAVAEERATYARKRMEQVEREREEAEERIESSDEELEGERERLREREEALGEVERQLTSHRESLAEVRQRLTQVREEVHELEAREREVFRRGAQLEGDAESAEEREEEMARRLEGLENERGETERALKELASQGDLFSDRMDRLGDAVRQAEEAVTQGRAKVEGLRRKLEDARSIEREFSDRVAALAAEVAALERMEQDREGVDPVVQELLSWDDEEILGVLADFIQGPRSVVAAAERYLGARARALVVRNARTARRLARWFRQEWDGGGGVVLLPADKAPDSGGSGGLVERLTLTDPGAGWARAFLTRVEYWDEEEAPPEEPGRGSVVDRAGSVYESGGVIRVGNPLGATGVLERRERLRDLTQRLAEDRVEESERKAERQALEQELRKEEETLEELRESLRSAQDEHRKAEADEQAHSERRHRVDETRGQMEEQVASLRTARERARERAREARRERTELLEEEERIRSHREEARGRLAQVEGEWEEARQQESGLNVEFTRLQGQLDRSRERVQELTDSREGLRNKMDELARERDELTRELERCRELKAEGEGEVEGLFRERTEAEDALARRDRELEEVSERRAAVEEEVRRARSAEREARERRHRMELERSEIQGRLERVRDRLEGEWGRSLEDLFQEAEPVEGEPEALQEELRTVVRDLEALGPVNMLAVEEHEEESQRLEFLEGQREDLVEARDDLRSAIEEINRTATQVFSETFEKVRQEFRDTFQRLFEGGECDLWLTDGEDPLESPVEIHASPVGKRTQRIDLLSGGERALTALALLFGIYLVKPSPFCVLDEVDAPLDESNIGRFIRLLQEFKEQTQFVVVTHNPRTIEAADWIYGVTMEEPGVSSVVGVRLEEALEAAGSAA